MNEVISIIIPIYNSSLFLRRCLDSVINQSYKTLQIILIDDGSDDDSLNICFEYKSLDNRITILQNEINKGIPFTRNKGISAATGKYIAFIDSDDYVELDYIEFLHNLIKSGNYDVAICGHNKIKKEKKYILNQKEAFKFLITDANFSLACWGKLYKKDLLSGIFFPNVVQCEDIMFLYDVFCKSNSSIYCTTPKYKYCIRKGSSTFDDYDDKDLERINQTKIMSDKIAGIYPSLKNKTKILYLNSMIAVCNKQLLSGIFDSSVIKKTKQYIRKNFLLILFNSSFLKNIQYFLFLFNSKVYLLVYCKIKKSALL